MHSADVLCTPTTLAGRTGRPKSQRARRYRRAFFVVSTLLWHGF